MGLRRKRTAIADYAARERNRGRRRVLVHVVAPGGPVDDEGGVASRTITLEGLLLGEWGGRLVLEVATQHLTAESSVSLGGTVEIPADRVLFVQVLDA